MNKKLKKVLKIISFAIGLFLSIISSAGYVGGDYILASITLLIGLFLISVSAKGEIVNFIYKFSYFISEIFTAIKEGFKSKKQIEERSREDSDKIKTVSSKKINKKEEKMGKKSKKPLGKNKKYCSSCGKQIKKEAEICPECGVRQKNPSLSGKEKSKTTAFLLALFLGGIGAHKFYLEDSGMGVLYLCFFWTGIPLLIGLVEGIIYLTMSDEAFRKKYG